MEILFFIREHYNLSPTDKTFKYEVLVSTLIVISLIIIEVVLHLIVWHMFMYPQGIQQNGVSLSILFWMTMSNPSRFQVDQNMLLEWIAPDNFMLTSIESEVRFMSYIAPQVKEKFDTLSVGLRNIILERDVQINTIHDLIRVLGEIVKEGEEEE
ncbi:hypothetical protein [Anaerosporobacter faecicola]|uniref:hypothetical protein n=1 Tax=Anaerosporobacter faecicola TaxID=2718714 RepID=UPI00143BD32D|nr:hypothetical protein [Anaerosporobacter faecicola]